ncbi:hypothetical protein [Streptomyces sp. NPDC093109]|uniref:hypothetical protein n=1 Tax=Streptomyces sp. NPDC093109 TaxID=3154977 RepID=UPI00344CFC66
MTTGDPRNVPALLRQLRQDNFSGTVRLSGAPGGTIHLRAGLVGAIETPGTPSVESALLKTGRIDDEGWAAALTATRETDGLGAALAGQGRISEAELELVCAAAVFEGAFALSLGKPSEWEVGESAVTVLSRSGIEPHALAEETSRRVAAVSRKWGPPAELARAKSRPSAGADGRAARLPSRYRSLLVTANGRRTPRDLAFTLGRGLFGVMADLIRMDGLGLIEWDRPRRTDRPSTAPRARAGQPVAVLPAPAASLPRRIRGASPDRTARGPELPAPQDDL